MLTPIPPGFIIAYVQLSSDTTWEAVIRNSSTGEEYVVQVPRQDWPELNITPETTCAYMRGWAQSDIDRIIAAMWQKPAGFCNGNTSGDKPGPSTVGCINFPGGAQICIDATTKQWLTLGGAALGVIMLMRLTGGSGKK